MAVHPLQFSPEGNLSRRLHPVELDHPGPLICIHLQDGPQAEGGVLHPLPRFIQVSPILLRQVLVRKLDIVPGLPDQALLRLAGVGEQALVDVQQEAGGVADGAVMVPAPQLLRGTAPSPPGSWPQRTGGAPPPCRGGYGPLLDRSKPTPSVQTVGREEIETIADQLISENLEAFRKLAMPE